MITVDNTSARPYCGVVREMKPFPAGSLVAWLLVGWTVALLWGLA